MHNNPPKKRPAHIALAQYGGFCYGVKRAVEAVERALQEATGPVYTLGEIIHNQTVVEELERRGVRSIDSLAEAQQGATVIIRAHGCVPEIFAQAQNRGIVLIDATCPDVRKVQLLAQEHAGQNQALYIVGKPEHPEVMGIAGWSGGRAVVLPSLAAVEALPQVDRAAVLSQTTMKRETFVSIVEALRKKCGQLTVCDTICKTTQRRQQEAFELSKKSDAVVVVGGKHSSNTRELYEIAKRNCKNVWIVEKAEDILLENPSFYGIIHIIAGASTPSWMMMEVFTRMNELEKIGRASCRERV